MKSIGIDIGGTTISVGLVQDGQILKLNEIRNTFIGQPQKLADRLKELICTMESMDKIRFIGVGIPGGIRNGTVYGAVNIAFDNVPLERMLSERTGVTVRIENDAAAAVIGEFTQGALSGTSNSMLLTLGTGVGGGIIIGSKVYKGSKNSAGEFGHVVYQRGGHLCSCRKKGCFEQYASATALLRRVRQELAANKDSLMNEYCQGSLDNIDGKLFFKAVANGDKLALDILEEFTFYIADGLCDFLNILDVERIAIGGGISEAGSLLIAPIREKVLKRGFDVEIVSAKLGNKAAVIGAANLIEMEA